jgi:hypothetical protein
MISARSLLSLAAAGAVAGALAAAAPAHAVDGGSPAPSTGYGFVASIQVGDAVRGCSGALVDVEWVISLPSCFAEPGTPLQTGPPPVAATVTVGTADLTAAPGREQRTVTRLVPDATQTLVLAKLSAPVLGATPVRIGGTALSAGETLRVAGFGRTATDWVPGKLRTADLAVQAIGDTTINLAGSGVLCRGDAGGPTLRVTSSGAELVALHGAAWQKGCLETPAAETRTVTTEVRTDSALTWIRQTIRPGTYVRLPNSAAVLDTRSGIGAPAGQRTGGSTTTFPVAGVGGVPATGVTAVLVDVTDVASASGSYLALFPDGTSFNGAASMVNAGGGQIISNTAVVPVPASGKISVYTSAAAHVVVDVEGYYTSAAGTGTGFVPVEPTRLVDTRGGVGGAAGTIPSGGNRTFTLTGGVIPAGSAAAFIDLIVTGATAYGWVGAYASGGTNRSVMDYVPGTTAHGVSVKLGTDGKATFTNNSGSPIHLVMTAEGYFTGSAATGSVVRTVPVRRMIDTRGVGTKAPLAANATVDVATGVPAGSTAILNLTIVGNTVAAGYLRAWPVDGTEPSTSLVNYPPVNSSARAGMAFVKVGTDGKIRIKNVSSGTVHLLADLQGWYAADPAVPTASTGGTGTTDPIADPPAEGNGGSLVEPFAYPNADQVLATEHVKLISGDGRILQAPCDTPATGDIGVLKVYSTDDIGSEGVGRVCFRVVAAPGRLTLQVPNVFEIRGDGQRTGTGHAVTAKLTNAEGEESTVAVDPDGSTQVGIGTDPDASPTTLLKLSATA